MKLNFLLGKIYGGKLCPDKNKRHMYRDKIVDQQKAAKLEPIIEKIQPDIIISYNA